MSLLFQFSYYASDLVKLCFREQLFLNCFVVRTKELAMAKVIQDVPYGINSTKLDRWPHETFASFKAKRTNGICLCPRLLGGNYAKFDAVKCPDSCHEILSVAFT